MIVGAQDDNFSSRRQRAFEALCQRHAGKATAYNQDPVGKLRHHALRLLQLRDVSTGRESGCELLVKHLPCHKSSAFRRRSRTSGASAAISGNKCVSPCDRPLVGRPSPHKWHVRLYVAELFGTAAMVGGGVSIVIFMFGTGSPAPVLLPSEAARRLLTGFLFGLVGALVTVSPVGSISGAHLNPAVTLAFHAERKLGARDTLGYIVANCLAAC